MMDQLLRDIAAYLAQDSPSAATTCVERVDRTVRRLSGQPRSGRIVPELERHGIIRYRDVVLSPWRLFYRYEQETAFILALIDGRRDIQDILLWRLMRDEPRGDR